jgi:hypothetical protein
MLGHPDYVTTPHSSGDDATHQPHHAIAQRASDRPQIYRAPSSDQAPEDFADLPPEAVLEI